MSKDLPDEDLPDEDLPDEDLRHRLKSKRRRVVLQTSSPNATPYHRPSRGNNIF